MRVRTIHVYWAVALLTVTAFFSSTLNTSSFESASLHDQQADLIIFSYDRPLQLYALLESIAAHVRGLDSIHVVYRCSTPYYEEAYKEVWQTFPTVMGYQQGQEGLLPEQDFKPLTLRALHACSHDYVIFAVDDMIVKDAINCTEAIELLEFYGAYGFYLRMGKNLDACYTMSRAQPLPPFVADDGHICIWKFSQGVWDWNYPHTVDMTLYRKQMVVRDLSSFEFKHPTQLEATWASHGWKIINQLGICYATSKVVNVPLNLVQHVLNNRHMDFMSCADLLEMFNQHKKIDISLLYGIDNKSAHMEYVPTFIDRI